MPGSFDNDLWCEIYFSFSEDRFLFGLTVFWKELRLLWYVSCFYPSKYLLTGYYLLDDEGVSLFRMKK